MKTLIKVTQEHIYKAAKSSARDVSAIHRAIKDCIKCKCKYKVLVCPYISALKIIEYLNYNTRLIKNYKMPRSVARFINNQYNLEKLKPFNFYLQEKQNER